MPRYQRKHAQVATPRQARGCPSRGSPPLPPPPASTHPNLARSVRAAVAPPNCVCYHFRCTLMMKESTVLNNKLKVVTKDVVAFKTAAGKSLDSIKQVRRCGAHVALPNSMHACMHACKFVGCNCRDAALLPKNAALVPCCANEPAPSRHAATTSSANHPPLFRVLPTTCACPRCWPRPCPASTKATLLQQRR